jgi:serine phosphatase RsbU (regulator of sigma subunit)
VLSSAGHLPPVIAAPGSQAGLLPLKPDPPIGIADDPPRRSATFVIPPGALVCCFTDGLVERRDQMIDDGMDRLAATMDKLVAAGPSGTPERSAEDACAEAMRALVGNAPAPDDIAVVMLSRPGNPDL